MICLEALAVHKDMKMKCGVEAGGSKVSNFEAHPPPNVQVSFARRDSRRAHRPVVR